MQAKLLSGVIVDASEGQVSLDEIPGAVMTLALVFLLRAMLGSASEAVAFRASARVKQELRESALREVLQAGPGGSAGRDPGALAALVCRGIDGLDGYFSRYLPQLVLAVIVPVAVLLTILGQDLLSTLIIAVTLPLIPIFMILIGWYTRSRVDRQWRTLAILSGHFLDLIAGLPTLKAFGRAQAQVRAIRLIGDEYRRTTLGVLRVSFLSSLALELLASLSIALVAVSIGLRLAEGQMSFAVALFILVLAPEAYLPLRLVGQHFHAAAEGVGAMELLFTSMPEPEPVARPRQSVSLGRIVTLRMDGVSVCYEQGRPALDATTFTARSGSITALVGRSGGGKSTLLSALLDFVPLAGGRIEVMDARGQIANMTDLESSKWRSRMGWVPQRPCLVGGDAREVASIRKVISLGKTDARDEDIWEALQWAGVADEIRDLPGALDALIRADGVGLSVGQLQRLALARALIGRPEILLLDEPTAALDAHSEHAVTHAVRSAAAEGAIVLVVAHRPAIVQIADQVVRVESLLPSAGGQPWVDPVTEVSAGITLGSRGW